MPTRRQGLALGAGLGGGFLVGSATRSEQSRCRAVSDFQTDPGEWTAVLVGRTQSSVPVTVEPWDVSQIVRDGPSRLERIVYRLLGRRAAVESLDPIGAIETVVACTAERGQYTIPLDETAAAELDDRFESDEAYRDEPDDESRPEYYFELPARHDGVVVELVWLQAEGE